MFLLSPKLSHNAGKQAGKNTCRRRSGRRAQSAKPGFNVNFKVNLEQKDKALLVPYEAVVEKRASQWFMLVGQDARRGKRKFKRDLATNYLSSNFRFASGRQIRLIPGEQIKDGVKVIVNAAGK
jgi:hypothetical protein